MIKHIFEKKVPTLYNKKKWTPIYAALTNTGAVNILMERVYKIVIEENFVSQQPNKIVLNQLLNYSKYNNYDLLTFEIFVHVNNKIRKKKT